MSAIRSLEIGSDGTYFAKLSNGDEARISESYLKAVKARFCRIALNTNAFFVTVAFSFVPHKRFLKT